LPLGKQQYLLKQKHIALRCVFVYSVILTKYLLCFLIARLIIDNRIIFSESKALFELFLVFVGESDVSFSVSICVSF